VSELSELDTELLLGMCQHEKLSDLLNVIHDYCDDQTHNMALTTDERHTYRKMRDKLERIANFADLHTL
jgi:hypothetical protein